LGVEVVHGFVVGLSRGHPGDGGALVVGRVNKSNLKIFGIWVVGHVVSDVDLNGLTKHWVWRRYMIDGFCPGRISNFSNLNSMDINSNTIKPDGVRKIVSYRIDLMGSDSLKSLIWEVNDKIQTQMEGPCNVDVTVCAYVNGVTHWIQ